MDTFIVIIIIVIDIIVIIIVIIMIIIIMIIIISFKCCFDAIICQVFNLRPEADRGLIASLYRFYVLDWEDFSEYVSDACKNNFLHLF